MLHAAEGRSLARGHGAAVIKMRDKEEHAFRRISEDLAAGAMPGVVLLCGKEQYLVKWSVNSIIEKYIEQATAAFDLTELQGENATADAVTAACETLPVMSPKKVVYLPDYPPLAGRKAGSADAQSEAKKLAAYLGDIPDTTILVMTYDPSANESPDRKGGMNQALFKAAENYGAVYDFGPLDQRTLKAFINKRFAAAGIRPDQRAVETIIDVSGYTRRDSDYTIYDLVNDISKMIAVSDGGNVTEADVLSVTAGSAEKNVFAMIDALAAGRKQDVFRLYFNLAEAGEDMRGVVNMMIRQFELMLISREMSDEGRSVAEIGKATGISSEYRIKRTMQSGRRFSVAALRRALLSAYRIDTNVRAGLLDMNTAVEIFISQV